MPLTDPDLHVIDRFGRDMLAPVADCENCDKGVSATVRLAIAAVAGALSGAVLLFLALAAAGAFAR